jgi:hypothetical protein
MIHPTEDKEYHNLVHLKIKYSINKMIIMELLNSKIKIISINNHKINKTHSNNLKPSIKITSIKIHSIATKIPINPKTIKNKI